MIRIRYGTVEDAPHAVRMGLRFRAEYAPQLRENPAQMDTIARFLAALPHALLLAEVEGVPVGMLGLAVVTHPLSGDLTASELFWWVDPEHRTGRTGLNLLSAAEDHARYQQCAVIHMVSLATNYAVSTVYTRRGYTHRDSTFEKAL